MRYLVTSNIYPPFLTNWFDSENNFNPDINMVVYNLISRTYTTDGTTWNEITIDHL